MDSSVARRRLQAIQDHLVPADDLSYSQLRLNATAGEFFNGLSLFSLTCSLSAHGVICSEYFVISS